MNLLILACAGRIIVGGDLYAFDEGVSFDGASISSRTLGRIEAVAAGDQIRVFGSWNGGIDRRTGAIYLAGWDRSLIGTCAIELRKF